MIAGRIPLAVGPTAQGQRGSFLLEALIAILIVALGVLGSVGLLARSMQDIDDAKFRGEAAYLANGLVGQMWVADRTTTSLDTTFGSATAGTGYADFKTMIESRLPNAALCPADVAVVAGPIAVTTTNSIVTITIRWLPPAELTPTPPACTSFHKFDMMATIGANR